MGKPSQKPIRLLVLGKQLVHQLNVLSLGVGLGGTLQVLPGLPLVLTLQVKNTWLGGRVVANSGLLVQAVQAQQFVVRWTFGQGVNSFGLFMLVRVKYGGKLAGKKKKIIATPE